MGPVALHVTASPVLYSFPWYRESSCSIEPGFGLCFFSVLYGGLSVPQRKKKSFFVGCSSEHVFDIMMYFNVN